MKYFAGIDGGGTKTEIVFVDACGHIVKRAIGGSSNPNDIGNEKMYSVLKGLIEENMPKDADSVDICMGISGASFAGIEDYLAQRLKENKLINKIDVCSDIQIAIDCAFDGDGCIVIIGTGSVGVVRENNKLYIIGGGGYLIDNVLSGYDLGREALKAILHEADGRGQKTLLSKLFFDKTHKTINQAIKDVYNLGKPYIASFSKMVFDAYNRGDKVAENILIKCINAFEKLLNALYNKNNKEKCDIAVFGGLSYELGTIKNYLSKEIKEKVHFFITDLPVVFGAIKRINSNMSKEFIVNFNKDYKTFLEK